MLQCSSAAQPIARLASGMSQALGRVLGQLGTGEKLQWVLRFHIIFKFFLYKWSQVKDSAPLVFSADVTVHFLYTKKFLNWSHCPCSSQRDPWEHHSLFSTVPFSSLALKQDFCPTWDHTPICPPICVGRARHTWLGSPSSVAWYDGVVFRNGKKRVETKKERMKRRKTIGRDRERGR